MKKVYSKPVMKAHIVKRINVIATSGLSDSLNGTPKNDNAQNSFGRGWDWDDDDWD